MRTLLSLYVGLTKHTYFEKDGTEHEDHTAGIQDVLWLGAFIFWMCILGGAF